MLQEGVDFVTLAMGMFGIGEILINLEKELTTELVTRKISHLWPTLKDWAESKWAILRGPSLDSLSASCPEAGQSFRPSCLMLWKRKFQNTGGVRKGCDSRRGRS